MKTKEQYIEEYITYLYGAIPEEDKPLYQPEITQSRADFKSGFNLAEELFKPKWISVEKQLPDNDRTVLVWVNDTRDPKWSSYELGSYINENWYLMGGRDSYEEVTHWCQIPEKLK